jgi:hypothetical protein
MKHPTIAASLAMIAIGAWPVATAAQERPSQTDTANSAIEIPESIQIEHEAIHSALVAATSAPGRVGTAARALADVLLPHFEREEEIALPPLALLAPLAAGEPVSEAAAAAIIEMTTALRAELPQMLEEHVRVHAAVVELRAAAEAANADAEVELADHLALHAETEEDVLYPAALLVGDVLRARRAQR